MGASRDEGLGGGELELLDAAFPADVGDPANWERGEELLPSLDAAALAERGGEELPTAVALLTRAARFEFARGRFEAALTRARAAVEAAAGLGETAAAGDPHRIFALALSESGRDEEAKEQIERALHFHALVGDPGDEAVREDRVLLSQAHQILGHLDAAREEAELALSSVPPGTVDRASGKARGQMALLLQEQAEYDEALALCRQAREELDQACGPRHPESLSPRLDLGFILAEADRLDASREELEAAVALSTEVLRADHPTVALARLLLGKTLQSLDDHAAAKVELEAALKQGEAVLPAGHRSLRYRHLQLAKSLEALGDQDGALAHIDAAIAVGRAADPPDPERLAGDLITRARLFERRRRPVEAFEAFAEARAILATVPGARPFRRGQCEIGMGRAAKAQGNLTTARTHLEAAVGAYGEVEGDSTAAGWEQGARVELAMISARIAEELAASCRAFDRPDAARTVLDRGRELFAEVLSDILADANLIGAVAVADAARQSSMPKLAAEALRQAETLPREDPEARARIGAAWHRLGRSCRRQGDPDEALAAFRAAIPSLDGEPQFQGVVQHDIAEVHAEREEWPEAVALYREAVELKLRSGDPRADRASTLIALARALVQSGAKEEALAVYLECRDALDAAPGHDLRLELALLDDLGELKAKDGEAAEAAGLFGRVAELARELEDPMLLANALLDLGRSRYALEEYDDALAAYEERLEILRSLPESDPQGEGVTLHDIADVHEARGDLPRAAALLRDAVDHKRRGGEIPRDLGVSLLALGRALVATEDLADAVAAFEERVAILRSLPEPEHHSEAVTLHELGAALGQAGRHAEAIDALRQAEALERESGEEEELAFTLLALGRVLRRSGDGGAALDAFEERLGILDSGAEPDGRAEATTLQEIAETLVELERPAEAVARYEEAIARHRELAGNLDGLAVLLFGAANLRLGLRDLDQARSLAEESVELLRVDPEPDPMQLSAALMTLGDATMRAGESQRAVPLLEESHRLLVDAGADPIELAILGRRLAAAYSATGREQDSRRYQENARAALAEGLDEGVKNPTMLPMLATIAAEVGAPELVERLIDEARASAAEDPAGARGQSLLVDVLRSAGWGYETAAEPAAAIGPYSERLAILEGLPERDMEAEGRARRDLGDVHRDLGESAAAIAAYRQAADCLRESGHRFAAATCQRYLAEVQAEEGDHAGALTTLAERLTLLGEEPEGDERRRLELATFEHIARSHLAAGSEGEARKAVEEAQRVLAEGGEADEEIAAGLRELAAELGLD